jgi:hypothetical protein
VTILIKSGILFGRRVAGPDKQQISEVLKEVKNATRKELPENNKNIDRRTRNRQEPKNEEAFRIMHLTRTFSRGG